MPVDEEEEGTRFVRGLLIALAIVPAIWGAILAVVWLIWCR